MKTKRLGISNEFAGGVLAMVRLLPIAGAPVAAEHLRLTNVRPRR